MTTEHPHGYFLDDSPDGHYFDKPLCDEFCRMFKGNWVLDLGCGKCEYVHQLYREVGNAMGVDGSPILGRIPHALVVDLSIPYRTIKDWDVVISLEVGEHIPPEFEDVFLDNVANNANKMIVLSWAVPGQGGRGHVNERSNGWVINNMYHRGWMIDGIESVRLRRIATLPWFKNTLMVFVPL